GPGRRRAGLPGAVGSGDGERGGGRSGRDSRQVRGLGLRVPRCGESGGREDHGGQEGTGSQCPAHFLEYDRKLDESVPVPTVLGGQGEPLQPELLGHLSPERRVVAQLGLHDLADLLFSGLGCEEVADGGARLFEFGDGGLGHAVAPERFWPDRRSSRNGTFVSPPGSLGSPSTRSARMFFMISSVPPRIRSAGVDSSSSFQEKVPHSPVSAMSRGPAISAAKCAPRVRFWAYMSLDTEASGPGWAPARNRRTACRLRYSVAIWSAASSARRRRAAASPRRPCALRIAVRNGGDTARAAGPAPSPPTLARSFISVVSATRQPPSTSPRRWSSGTRTSSRKTSLNSAPPLICRSGRTSTPGADMSTMNAVMPL